MRAHSAFPLDDDIVDRILTFCHTFSSLHSMVLVSKACYNVFQTRPNSITRAVAYNMVGPALPQALRAIRYPLLDADGVYKDTNNDDPDTMATTCPEEHGATVITPEEKQKLEENSEVVDTLEYIFSLTQKDRTSPKNILTPEESWRFRRAVYRIWLYTSIFSGDRYSLDDINELDDDEIGLIQRQRTAVLNEYPTDELFQLYAVVRSFRGILEDGGAGPQDSLGPGGIAGAWKEGSYIPLEDGLAFGLYETDEENRCINGYFSLPLENIWNEREVEPPEDDEPGMKFILDTINGVNDTCVPVSIITNSFAPNAWHIGSKCATPGGLTLLTEANWHRLRIWPGDLLKGWLKNDGDLSSSLMMAVLEHKETRPEWDSWTAALSYCQPCLVKFLEEHVWRWFLDKRVKDGWSPPENCPFGYNCQGIVVLKYHAKQKNEQAVRFNVYCVVSLMTFVGGVSDNATPAPRLVFPLLEDSCGREFHAAVNFLAGVHKSARRDGLSQLPRVQLARMAEQRIFEVRVAFYARI
ncbi:hypothetical protein B0H13DRAFT_2365548 [Mycena leptocephala]|nr:hypothetical protein B0H13DRAFT_2365548 [Mycena leptocephala]